MGLSPRRPRRENSIEGERASGDSSALLVLTP
jgi:hypothetical protein